MKASAKFYRPQLCMKNGIPMDSENQEPLQVTGSSSRVAVPSFIAQQKCQCIHTLFSTYTVLEPRRHQGDKGEKEKTTFNTAC